MSIYNTETGEEKYFGCVVYLGEHNWYDDSDFYAIVWDEAEQTFKSVGYASTRYYSYHIGANIDASEDLMLAYELWCKRGDAISRVKGLWNQRSKLIELRKACNLDTYLPLKDLRRAYRDNDLFDGCIKLLKTKKFRSEFRKSLDTQLREWLACSPEERTHAEPFSRKQAQYVY